MSRSAGATVDGKADAGFGEVFRPWLLLSPAIVFLAVLFVTPLLQIVRLSFGQTGFELDSYITFLGDGFYLGVLLRTLYVAFVVALFCLFLGYPVAYVAARYRGDFGKVILLIVTMSLWTSFLVRTYAWMVILGSQGPVSWLFRLAGWDPPPRMLFTAFSANIGMIHILLPFMVMSLYAVMLKIDPSLLRAARIFGASPFHAFRTVFLPLSLPGVINGFILVFIICIGFYVTPALLGGPQDQMIARLIGAQIEQLLDWQEAATMATVLLAVTLVLFAIYDFFFGLDQLWRS